MGEYLVNYQESIKIPDRLTSRIDCDPGPGVGKHWSMLWCGSKLQLIELLSFRPEWNIMNLSIFFIFLVIKFKLLFFDFQLLKVNGFGSEKTFLTWNFNESSFFKYLCHEISTSQGSFKIVLTILHFIFCS